MEKDDLIGKKYGILIVEDDETTRSFMGRIISAAGFEVKETALAADGLKAIDETIQLAVIDIGLPDYDGQNLVARIRRHYDKKRLKICFASGKKERDTIKRCLELGGDDYLIKPIDKDMLLQKITKLLGQESKQFAWVSIECQAELMESSALPELKVVRLSESGLLLKSSCRFQDGAYIKLDCPGLSRSIQAPFQSVINRVTSCEKIRKSYFVATEFVGLSEDYLQPIRALAIRGQIIMDINSFNAA